MLLTFVAKIALVVSVSWNSTIPDHTEAYLYTPSFYNNPDLIAEFLKPANVFKKIIISIIILVIIKN